MNAEGFHERIFGFSAREMWQSFAGEPRSDSDFTFFLRDGIIKPLSVDRWIWPDVLMSDQLPDNVDRTQFQRTKWHMLSELHASLPDDLTDYWTIAITMLVDATIAKQYGIGQIPVEPSEIDASWQFLGFDVAETGLLSGLMDMGYRKSDGEAAFAQRQFGAALNENHLFTDRDIARNFAAWSDTRDPGHGPFYVFGIYQIEAR